MSLPRRCRPTSAGSDGILNMAKPRGAGRQPAVRAGFYCARRYWRRPSAWIASRPRDAPAPTAETQSFLTESRRGASWRRNILSGSLAAGLLVALALAGLTYWQRGIAIEQQRIAEEQRKVAESRRTVALAEQATGERLQGNWESALRLIVHAARLALDLERDGPELPVPRAALAAAVAQSDWRLMLRGHESAVLSAAFSPDGARIVTASRDHTARIFRPGPRAHRHSVR